MAITTPLPSFDRLCIREATKNPQVGKELTEHAHRHP